MDVTYVASIFLFGPINNILKAMIYVTIFKQWWLKVEKPKASVDNWLNVL